ncbi:hypothetical protein ACQBAT_08065 [Ornithinimicrobium sp. Y1847]|uniref:aldose epimerase family protein n=1 Tax=Ornithinimicrobium sp. Y1847 TaxID=3405419 RepID=UPI003B6805E8
MTTMPLREVRDEHTVLRAYDHGATVVGWEVDGQPVLWLSPRAVVDGSTAIRGGVPLCFPWFGAGRSGDRSPSHGPVRTATWRAVEPTGAEVMAWELSSEEVADTSGGDALPGPFQLRYAATRLAPDVSGQVGPGLHLALTVHNPATAPLEVEAALHTDLVVPDSTKAQVLGLTGTPYLDKVTGERAVQEGPVTFGQEVDRVLDGTGSPAPVLDRGDGSQVLVQHHGATQTVVWNPGPDNAGQIRDVGADGWREFVCVETAATGDLPLVVSGGASSVIAVTLILRGDPSSR